MLQQQRMSCLNRSSTAFSWCKTLTAFHWHDYSSQSEAVSAWEIFVKRPTALTPPTITPRNVAFRGGTLQERWWLGRNPVATAFYNSMSVIFAQARKSVVSGMSVSVRVDIGGRSIITKKNVYNYKHQKTSKKTQTL